MTVIRKSAARDVGDKAERSNPAYMAGGNVKMVQSLWQTILALQMIKYKVAIGTINSGQDKESISAEKPVHEYL